jgi:hypothetical protein
MNGKKTCAELIPIPGFTGFSLVSLIPEQMIVEVCTFPFFNTK